MIHNNSNPLVVYSSNIFAIGGLRAVFNILSQAVSELRYLEKAVGLVLGVIAVKLACESVDVTLVTPVQSLLLVLGILGGGVAASLLRPLPASVEGDNAGEV
jgi:predicted tellurium resistance membrane protein TerC